MLFEPSEHDSATQTTDVAQVRARSSAWVTNFSDRPLRRFRAFLILGLALALAACDEGGGGSPSAATSASSSSPQAVQTIDLAPGQAVATLGWAPSRGRVSSYVVYESRNGGSANLVDTVLAPRVTVSGNPGDSVRITVVALNEAGKPSKASPASPELRFHAAPASALTESAAREPMLAAQVVAPAAGPESESSADAPDVANEVGGSDAAADVAADGPSDGDTALAAVEDESVADEDEGAPLDAETRELLIESDARFPLAGLGDASQNWLQARVEEHFSAGVRLVGTGELDADGLNELVWQDPSGQLLLSTGRAIVDTPIAADIPSTFEDGVRLRATERFVALADFDGDAVGDWLIEDVSTGEVWLVDAETLDATSARSDLEADEVEIRLVGHGDFDADGRHELLWQHADGQLRMGHPSGDVPSGEALPAANGDSVLGPVLAVADVDGDGNDDLISIDADGRLAWTRVVAAAAEGGAVTYETLTGAALDADALDLLVTLDLDGDDRAEIAFLNGDTLEVWDPANGPEDL